VPTGLRGVAAGLRCQRGWRRFRKLYVAPLLADLSKTCGFKAALDLAIAERLKPPHQPLPRFGAQQESAWQPAVRSAIPVPHADSRELRLQFVPGSRRLDPGL